MKQKIKSIQLSQAISDGHTLYGEGGEAVGSDGITHITSDFPSNAHCEYVYVWKGDDLYSEHPKHHLIKIVYFPGSESSDD
jgi:hypothetical protein